MSPGGAAVRSANSAGCWRRQLATEVSYEGHGLPDHCHNEPPVNLVESRRGKADKVETREVKADLAEIEKDAKAAGAEQAAEDADTED
jgi:hypothetical protein